ncbi:Nn.00g069110.m01.CDS01 [Neocucurbitaria sp. VM-36]
MSVSVEQPLHFSQQPSSPSFSSPPQSPNHRLHAQTPASPPPLPPPPADMDMSSSITTLPPAGQRHDREDAEMQDGEGLTNGHGEETANPPSNREPITNSVAVEVAAVDEDAMDTAPDTDQERGLPNGSADPNEALVLTPTSPAATGETQVEPSSNEPALSTAHVDDATQTESNLPIDPPPPGDPSEQPPPPPPPVEPVRSDSDSSDDDDGVQPWHPIQEDTSSPDEAELKEIEEMTEHSALDHEYWESKAFLPLEEPEYTAGETGRIHWSIDAYNGTRENPNRDILMKSDPVTIGGHQWQIKFYPRGNDSDYLSVYLECVSVVDPKKDESREQSEGTSKGEAEEESKEEDKEVDATMMGEITPEETSAQLAPTKPQHAPLPLLGSKTVPKRKCVAAQVSVVLYNPTEPRVNYSRTALHRFCNGSPDWGWTRFHGPYYDISHRMRGQRQALLRDDKLAFTGYVRIIEDETNCLWEHHSRDNPWDSFAMTGLQGLMLGENASAPGGNMISAIASWMLFKPFRNLLYNVEVADPENEPFVRPKPLISALQKVLYMLRTQVDPGAGSVALDDVLDALEWYGIHERLDKLDVIEIWEVLRSKLEEELQHTPHITKLQDLYGPKRDYSVGVPSYRVPVLGVDTMQEAISKSTGFVVPGQPLPQLLAIELERQDFDLKTRSYVKLLNKVTLDDQIAVGDTHYTLYGFVVHKQTLQSYVYQPIIRPEGPGSRWYSYSDSKDENQVRCLTKQQAVDAHEGKPGTEQVIGNDAVAYIAMYVRDDTAQATFVSNAESEQWDVPEWIKNEVEKSKTSSLLPPMPPPPADESAVESGMDGKPEETEALEMLDFQVVDSRTFAQHEGPGVFDAYDAKWEDGNSDLVFKIQLSSKDGCKEIREKLVSVLKDIQDPRQVKFWFLDPIRGCFGRPNLLGTGKIEYSSGSYDRYADLKNWNLGDSPFACRRIWVHVIEFDKLPELPEKDERKEEPTEETQAQTLVENIQVDASNDEVQAGLPPPEVPPQSEDTPMSEPEDPVPVPIELPAPEIEVPPVPETVEGGDATMAEGELPPVSEPIQSTTALGDTEMGGTQEDLPPPPPPPGDIQTEPVQPPPPARTPSPEPPADEIYFFLKLWNAEKQTLESKGTHIALKSVRVDETVVTLLGLPMEEKKKVEIWEEEELITTRPIKHRRTFSQVDLHNSAIIIVALPRTAEQRNALAARAAFADPQSYLAYRAFARNFPSKLNGHFTYKYFSSQHYKGEITNGQRHGHGLMIYHSGATYSGTFRLGQRHGHGLYTFQNGDTYDGTWEDNQQHGSGTFVEAATGNTYVGGWQHDKKFGEGVTHWKNAQEAERLCRICWDEPAEAAFYDCGHVVACLGCAREVQSCPVCRKRVLSAMKLYYVA